MTAQFQFFQSLPHKKADFVKKKPAELGVLEIDLDNCHCFHLRPEHLDLHAVYSETSHLLSIMLTVVIVTMQNHADW